MGGSIHEWQVVNVSKRKKIGVRRCSKFEVRRSKLLVVLWGNKERKERKGTFGGEGFIVLGGVRGWIQTGYRKKFAVLLFYYIECARIESVLRLYPWQFASLSGWVELAG